MPPSFFLRPPRLVAVLLCTAVAAVFVLLPTGYALTSVEAVAVEGKQAVKSPSGLFWAAASPKSLLRGVMAVFGVRPPREPWVPSGVDYGNTHVPPVAEAAPVCMAWQYRPRKLTTVPKGITVLAPTWFYVESGSEGKAETHDLNHVLDQKITNWDPVQYVTAAHKAGVRVWAVVSCLGQPNLAKQIVTDTEGKNRFISQVAGWVREYNLDGISFDFEKMDPADNDAFTSLVAECKQALPPGATVSVAVTVPLKNPEGNWWQSYDREGLGRVADYVAVMTYDYKDLEPTAAIGWVDGKIKDMLELVPSDKLLMGVPFYGTDFRFESPKGEKLVELPELKKSLTHVNVFPSGMKTLLGEGTLKSGSKTTEVEYWIGKGLWLEDKAAMQYSFVDKAGVLHVVYCEEERSLLAKGRLAAFRRLAGVAVWRIEKEPDTWWQALTDGMNAVN